MLIKLIKKYMPNHMAIKEHRHLKIFGNLLHSPRLWHFNRHSVSGAFAVGLFCAWIPVPSQMIIAAAIAILLNVNLPLSVALVWFSNPVTMPPLFYGAYKFGAWILGRPALDFEFVLSMEWLMNKLIAIWEPFLLGCFLFGVASSVGSYIIIRILWRYHIIKQWHSRHQTKIQEN
ncbi:MAG: DUF2062 domain-containing protein [Gammaproteobacteria bacterium]|nr:DUF2062 domain-containing protein [Gammaproteobacteria bacterium]